MKKVGGISLTLSSFEEGLWFDSDLQEYQPKGWGVKLNIVWGKMIRPVPKFWKGEVNAWLNEPWFVIRIPFIVAPYLSIALGRVGFYLGFKTFSTIKEDLKLLPWLREDEVDCQFLQLTATTRRTRW